MSREQPIWIYKDIEEFDTLDEAKLKYPNAKEFYSATFCKACRKTDNKTLIEYFLDNFPKQESQNTNFSLIETDKILSNTGRREESELVIMPCHGKLKGVLPPDHKPIVVCKKETKKTDRHKKSL